ncbi:MAG: hypothetical protein H6Q13_2323 [Bacteroidetes bacterium]|jgi:hypothetical protein|nr:hypothetical protein [Bacteroidota bacterium]
MNIDMQNSVGFEMRPFVLKELLAIVMQKKKIPFGDALYYIYSSELYKRLLDEESKLWYLSTLSLYDLLEKEKTEDGSSKKDSEKVLLFKMFCIENYREKEKLSPQETLILFSEYKIFSFLEETFEMLHTQGDEYIMDSISTYIKNKKKRK